ncbi:MAG: peptidoglycan hydrolase-like protein with peptidoglycan-binding domain [Candidatus Azotimanducaceae bacterium]|jgi:peptidoglycan hydrolase-like protein with peptidoglycan-binding domain
MIKLSNVVVVRTRVVLVVLLSAFFFLVAPVAQAQSTEMQIMITRMESIMTQMELLQKEFLTLASGVQTTTAPQVLGASASTIFTQSLEYGDTNEDIKRIQTLLATDPEIYPYGVASGFFGPKTQEAIKNLQTRFSLDPLGIIGPATKGLLEGYLRAYPDGNYPDGLLSTKPKPQVLGVSTSNTPAATPVPTAPATLNTAPNPASSIEAELDKGEASVEIEYRDGTKTKRFIADSDDEDEVIDEIVSRTKLTEAQVRAVIEFDDDDSSSRSSRSDYDEDDAEDALDDADGAIDDADEDIEDAEEDEDDVEWAQDTLDDAKDLYDEAEEAFDDEDWDDAVELAEEAEEIADEAVDRIDEKMKSRSGDSDEIDKIKVDVDEDESEVTVKYDDDDDYEFTVDEDKEDEIIEEIADELDMDEDDVEDLIEFDYGSIDEIVAVVEDGEARITVTYDSGVEKRFTISEDDEDDLIEEIAEELDEDEDDIEDVIEFD